MRFKKEWYELIFRIQWSIYDGAFMRKQLRLQASSQIFGQGLNTPLMNKILFSFQIKTTLKATTLGIRMCCTKLLLWKNQKASTCYSMIYINGTPPMIFCLEFSIFFGQVISQNSSKPLIVTGFQFLRMSLCLELLLFSQGCARATVSM